MEREVVVFDLLRDWISCKVGGKPPSYLRGERDLARIAASARGTVGATGLHVETARSLSLNGDLPLPMASTVKVLIAAHVLWRIDRGHFALDSMLSIDPRHVCLDGEVIASRAYGAQTGLPLRALIELMLIVSNNTASDVLLAFNGGPKAIADWLSTLGRGDITVNRSIGQLIADAFGLDTYSADSVWTPALWREHFDGVSRERKLGAIQAFLRDPRDRCTTAAMAQMLTAIADGGLLSPSSSSLLLETMARCETGPDRIKGLMPAGPRVAHKTGLIANPLDPAAGAPLVTCDVGLVALPANRGRIAVAVTVAGSPLTRAGQDRVIARLARRMYDYFAAVPD